MLKSISYIEFKLLAFIYEPIMNVNKALTVQLIQHLTAPILSEGVITGF